MNKLREYLDTFVRIINNKNQKMKKIRQAVLTTAKALAHPNNTFTTLEIKNELIKTHSQYYWTQATVSQIMDEFAQNGQFTFTDNGTFRTYSDPTYVFPTAKTALKVVKTKRGVPVAQTPIKRKRGGQAGVKRGPYKTKNASLHNGAGINSAAAPVKRVVGRPRKTVQHGRVAMIPGSITPTNLKANYNISRTKPANPNHNVPALSKTKAVQILLSAKPRYSNKVEFISQKGLRKMKYELLPGIDKPDALGYLTVKDCKLAKVDPNNCVRNINCQTIKGLKVNAKRYTVK